MAGYVTRPVAQEYVSKKLSGATAVEIGTFLNVDLVNNEYDLPAANATADIIFVANEIDRAVDYNTDDETHTIAAGELIKGKKIIQTEEYITTKITANALAAALGTELGVGTGGTLATIADLAVANLDAFRKTFTIVKKTKLFMKDALIVEANVKF